MAARNKVQIIIELLKKGVGAKDATRDLKGLDGAVKNVQSALTGLAVVGVAKASYELAELGAQSLRTKHAFEMISGSAGEARQRLEAMKRATRGAMSEMQMMQAANRLMQMGLANNATELEKVSTMAVRLGTAMGRTATESLEQFGLLLANMSIPRLDTFGISAGKVRARILELQKQTPGLSREIAFMTATMEEGEEAMARLGEAVDDAALEFETAEARLADLRVELGERLAPIFADFLDTALHAGDIIKGWWTILLEAGQGLHIMGDGAEIAQRKLAGLWNQQVTTGASLERDLNLMLHQTERALDDAAAATTDFQGALDSLKFAISGPVRRADEEYEEERARLLEQLEEERDILAELERKHGQFVFSQDRLTIATADQAAAASNLAYWQQELGWATDPGKQQELAAEVARSNQRFEAANRTLESARGYYTNYQDDIDASRAKIGELEGSLTSLEQTHTDAIESIIMDLVMARIAQDNFVSDSEYQFVLELAEQFGMIDSEAKTMAEGIMRALDMVETDFKGAITQVEHYKNALAGIPRNITTTLTPAYGGGGAMERQFGGPVLAGVPYVVGERGPELFVPSRSGQVVNNRSFTHMGNTYNIQSRASLAAIEEANYNRNMALFERSFS